MTRLARLALIAAALALAGCSGGFFGGSKKNQPCPRVLIVKGADRLVRFAEGPGRDVTDIAFKAEVADFHGECSYDDDEADVDMTIRFRVERGPALGTGPAEFDYFVALPSYYPLEAGRHSFTARVPFGRDQRRLFVEQSVELTIPLRKNLPGRDHEILIGLKLTPDEVEYNRANTSVPR